LLSGVIESVLNVSRTLIKLIKIEKIHPLTSLSQALSPSPSLASDARSLTPSDAHQGVASPSHVSSAPSQIEIDDSLLKDILPVLANVTDFFRNLNLNLNFIYLSFLHYKKEKKDFKSTF
jgi:hypothetical protein